MSSSDASSLPEGVIPPNPTLYVRNLNEKIKKEALKEALYAIFGQFGQILDVVCLKTVKMRGQAFIVFKEIQSATNALRQLQNFPFFDKPMALEYGRSKSFATGKLDGTYEELKRKREEARQKEKEEAPKRKVQRTGARSAGGGGGGAGGGAGGSSSSGANGASTTTERPAPNEAIPPNKILFVQNLPETTTEAHLAELFQPFRGYKEIRTVPARPDIAFVEFENEIQAGYAKEALQGYKLSATNYMKIAYRKQ